MEDARIILSAIWAALMLSYLLGDVLRIYSGDYEKMAAKTGVKFTGKMWLGISMLMVIPCIMVVLTLTLDYSVSRWANIAMAIFFFGFNLIGLPSYISAFDKFLNVVGLGFNVMTVWYAWNWV
jgi:Family of unknown function (DUF6326)